MKMFNFLDSKLLPKVATSTAAQDDYDVTNLISDNYVIRSRGFIAYTSMKPPVDIDFELICPISIHHVTLRTVSGSQKTVAVEIFAGNSRDNLESIGRAFFDEDGVSFCNARYYTREQAPNSNYHVAFLKTFAFRSFTSCSVLRVRILRTERSAPCLGSVEIYGAPSKTCSASTVATVNKLMSKTVQRISNYTENSVQQSPVAEFQIPDDFKDALTFEIMAIPMTLPSGHSIDQSTLEKCTRNDATYGRQSCDPFTGLAFTNVRKPKLNVALKNRIDMFLLENGHRKEVCAAARTTGRKLQHIRTPDYACNYKKVKLSDKSDSGDTLDEAIAKVVSDSNFHCFTGDEAQPEQIKCAKCDVNTNLYVVPCKHLYCRGCLLKVTSILTCDVCNFKFDKKDVQRFHN